MGTERGPNLPDTKAQRLNHKGPGEEEGRPELRDVKGSEKRKEREGLAGPVYTGRNKTSFKTRNWASIRGRENQREGSGRVVRSGLTPGKGNAG